VTHLYASSGRDPLAKRIEIPDVETVDYWVGSIQGNDSGFAPSTRNVLDKYRAIFF
jgi:hypothetical protein